MLSVNNQALKNQEHPTIDFSAFTGRYRSRYFSTGQTNSINGAWRLQEPSGTIVILTMTDTYLMQTSYEPDRYVSTRDGTYRLEGDKLRLLVEFDTAGSLRVTATQTPLISL